MADTASSLSAQEAALAYTRGRQVDRIAQYSFPEMETEINIAFQCGWQARDQQRVTVTPEAADAVGAMLYYADDGVPATTIWGDVPEVFRDVWRKQARKLIEAALLVLQPNAPAGDNEEKKL